MKIIILNLKNTHLTTHHEVLESLLLHSANNTTNNKQYDLNLLAYYEIDCLADGPLRLLALVLRQQVRFDSIEELNVEDY